MINIKHLLILIVSLTIIGGSVVLAETTATDPMAIGVGARPLGMGKAFVAVAENSDALFTNPAGLGKIRSLKLTSMQATLLGEINYSLFGVALPIDEYTSLGFGGIISSISDIPLFTETGDSLGSGRFSKSMYFVSCGFNFDNLQVGTNFKYFNQSGSGSDDVIQSNGFGYSMDLGILYKHNSWLDFGVNFQNMFNGGMTFDSGKYERIESATKLGTKILFPENNTIIGIDTDITQYGSALHFGIEWQPIKLIALRAGIDQDSGPAQSNANATLGVGINLSGIEFDYAYHPYTDVPENTTHYFSISFIGID